MYASCMLYEVPLPLHLYVFVLHLISVTYSLSLSISILYYSFFLNKLVLHLLDHISVIYWCMSFFYPVIEPVGQMSQRSESLIVIFLRYLKSQWNMVLFFMFRHHCCSQNILDKRNSSTSGAVRCLGAVVWRL